MKQRCRGVGVSKTAVKNYHDKGIRYDPLWEKFQNFYNDMHKGYRHGLQIDRINNDAGYSKDNCRWVVPVVNIRNRSNTLCLVIDGVKRPFAEWCEIHKVPYERAIKRMTYYKIKDPEAIFYNGHLQTYWAEKSIGPCVECGTNGGTKRPNGLPRRSKNGLCNTCYHRKMRKRKKSALLLI